MRKRPPKRSSSPSPRGAHFDTFSALFSFRASGTLKKGGPGGPSKLDALFCPFGGLPGGPQEGSLCSDSSILTFAAGPKKGSKIEQKWSVLGSEIPTILILGGPGVFFWLWGEAAFWERFESGSQAFDTLDSLSAGCVCVWERRAVSRIRRGGQQEGKTGIPHA